MRSWGVRYTRRGTFSVHVPTDIKCPAKGCKMQYKTLRWLKAYIKTGHPQCTMNGKEQSVTAEQKSRQRNSPDEEELEMTAQEEIHPVNDPGVYQCPKCSRIYKALKSLQNHCSENHAWSCSRQMPVRGRQNGSSRAQNPATRDCP